MGKRSNFIRLKGDFYRTPKKAVDVLCSHIERNFTYHEPCAGDGALIEALNLYQIPCVYKNDIEPKHKEIKKQDAFDLDKCAGDCFVTNPPWTRGLLHPLIIHLSNLAPTWLLFDADWMHTKQAEEYLSRCEKIISVGRLKWIADSDHAGKDNCAWYLFGNQPEVGTVFIGRH